MSSDPPLLSPVPSRLGIPLHRSTVIVLIVLVLACGFLLSLLSGASEAPPSVTGQASATPPVQVGQARTIDDELSSSNRFVAAGAATPASAPQRATSAPTSPSVAAASPPTEPLPAGLPSLPPTAWRPPAMPALSGPLDRVGADVEQEARVRLAKALAHDFGDEPGRSTHEVARLLPGLSDVLGSRGRPNSAPVPPASALDGIVSASQAVAPQLDAVRQLVSAASASPAQAPGGSASGPDAWLREYGKEPSSSRSRPLTGHRAPHPLVLHQGKLIPAVLTRDVRSDLPGRITAQVSSPVYDSLGTGRLLIPMGAVLVGSYDTGVSDGQTRLLFAFERLILPDGTSFDLPGANGTDLRGAAGLAGDVDNRFARKFASAFFVAVLANQVRQPTQVTQFGPGMASAAGQVLVDISRSQLEQNRNIKPTLSAPAGTRIGVEVVSDMWFERAYAEPAP